MQYGHLPNQPSRATAADDGDLFLYVLSDLDVSVLKYLQPW